MTLLNESVSAPVKPRFSTSFFRFENPLWNYGLAVLSVSGAIVVHALLGPLVRDDSFEIFLVAVILSTYFGRHAGLGPGLLASILSILAMDYFFIPPYNTFAYAVSDFFRLSVFGLVAILISSFSSRLKKAKADLQHVNDMLDIRVHERTNELIRANMQLKEEVTRRLEAQKAILEISNREQQRLGQDLHDGLIQTLTGVRLIVEELEGKLKDSQHPMSEDMVMVETCLTEALGQADTISRGLYPVELETNGLMAALEELSEKISRVHPVSCLFICRAPILIEDPSTATHVYRIAQEAVSNAIKSGKAKRINIRLFKKNENIVLSIADNGVGFKKAHKRNGMGLKIMEYRTSFINGNLKFLSRSRGGTVVRCVFRDNRKGNENEI